MWPHPDLVERIAEQLLARSAPHRVMVAAIDGPGCSGKSTLSNALVDALGRDVVELCADDFLVPFPEQAEGVDPLVAVTNGVEHLRWREFQDCITQLRAGELAKYRPYLWGYGILGDPVELRSARVLLIEGLFSTHEDHRAKVDFSIWVDCREDERMRRVRERDGTRYLQLWNDRYIPRESAYLGSQRPDLAADLFLPGIDLDWSTIERAFCRHV